MQSLLEILTGLRNDHPDIYYSSEKTESALQDLLPGAENRRIRNQFRMIVQAGIYDRLIRVRNETAESELLLCASILTDDYSMQRRAAAEICADIIHSAGIDPEKISHVHIEHGEEEETCDPESRLNRIDAAHAYINADSDLMNETAVDQAADSNADNDTCDDSRGMGGWYVFLAAMFVISIIVVMYALSK